MFKINISIRLSVDSDFNLLLPVILYRRAILKSILETNPCPMWTGFIWLRKWSRWGLLLTLRLIICLIKRKFMVSPTATGFSTIALLPWFQQCQFRDFSSRGRENLCCDWWVVTPCKKLCTDQRIMNRHSFIFVFEQRLFILPWKRKREVRRYVCSCHDVISKNIRHLIIISYEILHISDLKFIRWVSLTSFSVSLHGNIGICHYLHIMINFVNCSWVDTRWQ